MPQLGLSLSALRSSPTTLLFAQALLLAAACLCSPPSLAAPPLSQAANAAQAAASAPPPPSSTGQRIYDQTRPRLLQVRTLLKTQDSQNSVGSGFLVTPEGHLITNYHVISSYALHPKRYRLVYVTVDGQQGPLQLLAFDVVHDLALLKPVDPAPLAGRGVVNFRPEAEPMARGARIFSLGNPLDVGFAVTEGGYNGLAERHYLPTIFFGGSLNAGVSGGPTVDEQGRLVGVNVAARRDGEQVSFLVPAASAKALLERGRSAQPITQPVHAEMARQLTAHQAGLTDSFIAQPWRSAGHSRYRIPVPQETTMRCWGSGAPDAARGLSFERSDCVMDGAIFIEGFLRTGFISVRHETYDGSKLGTLRFQQRYSGSYRNEHMGGGGPFLTSSRCEERTVDREGLPLRAVVCLAAYKKLPGLYNLSVLTATLDGNDIGAQGRLDVNGVSFENAQRLTQHYLNGFGWIAQKNASH